MVCLGNFLKAVLNTWTHIYFDAASQPLTAFITPYDLYEWMCVPFGSCNAPVESQRFMEIVFFDIREDFPFPYLDGVLVFTGTFLEHLKQCFSVSKTT